MKIIVNKLFFLINVSIFFSCQGNYDSNKKIILSDGIKILESDFEILSKLQMLDTSIHQSINFKVDSNGYVNSLSCKNIYFKELPNHIYKLKHLEYLFLSGSGLEFFPNLSELKYLRKLRIIDSKLKGVLILPNYLSNLTHLRIDNSEVTEMIYPNNSKLSELILYQNNIKKLNHSFYKLEHLKTLFISSNQIENINLGEFKHLENVDLYDNPLKNKDSLKIRYKYIKNIRF